MISTVKGYSLLFGNLVSSHPHAIMYSLGGEKRCAERDHAAKLTAQGVDVVTAGAYTIVPVAAGARTCTRP